MLWLEGRSSQKDWLAQSQDYMLLSFMLILLDQVPNIEITGMTSRTPIRLTPYRGPLATPSTSPESSPTLSTPPTNISHYNCATAIRPTLDVAILQHRISTLNPPTRHQSRSRLHRGGRNVAKQGLFDRSTQLSLIVESLVYSACDLANTLAGILAFCLLIWGLLEWVFNHLLAFVEGC